MIKTRKNFYKSVGLTLILFTNATIVKADTEHTLGALMTFAKVIGFGGSLFSALLLYYMFKKGKLLLPTIAIGIISAVGISIGNFLIDIGRSEISYNPHSSEGQELIGIGYFLQVVNMGIATGGLLRILYFVLKNEKAA